ncbi:DUF4861 family protein [Mangrovivirga cuniculi]|uniref:DUF4861 domain-containing protein n=1 Tax=Mangrovivirga cuniculi TaxID=2715131 RepID=A0A4D7JDF3_9BACT|nr:DUF4861 family protein [Mangrovivirga cuniculi]QCK13283.1 DUF4861 domain-containing protein [Mangrovivirga cuniculi]
MVNFIRTKYFFLIVVGSMLLFSCGSETSDNQEEKSLVVKIKNPTRLDRTEIVELTDVDKSQFTPGIRQVENGIIEAVDNDNDGTPDKLFLKVSLAPQETKTINLSDTENYEGQEMTQAEISHKVGGEWKDREYEGGVFKNVSQISVPDEHTDHSWFIRYEGPGLESEKVGYRFYLDWRNAVDIFGKKVDTLVLQEIGQDGFDSYHEPADWGMDILKAGKSLGIGSIGYLIGDSVVHFQQTDSVTCEISKNKGLVSSISTTYYGWDTGEEKTTVNSLMSINSDSRAVDHTLTFDTPLQSFCTGIVKNEAAEKIESLVGSNGWAYIATYGKQSLADDNLGLAIIYNTADVNQMVDGNYDHLIEFKPSEKVKYYFLGAWEQESEGIKNKDQFIKYLDEKVKMLNNPVVVTME